MKGRFQWPLGVMAGALLVAALCLPSTGVAVDYYSWIDANGTMMMTDDPSRIPSPTSRSQIQVHRFEPSTSGRRGVPEEAPAPVPREAAPPAARPDPVDPRDLTNLPLVVLAEPDSQVRAQYVWVPLLSPLLVRGNMVHGFWWHPGTISPVEAFKQFLAKHYRDQRPPWTPSVTVPYPSPYPSVGPSPSGNTVYDQVVRERQALEESIRLRHFPASPVPARRPSGGGGGHHSLRGR